MQICFCRDVFGFVIFEDLRRKVVVSPKKTSGQLSGRSRDERETTEPQCCGRN